MEDPSFEPHIPENSKVLSGIGYRFEDYRRMHCVLVAVIGSLTDGKLLRGKITKWCEKLYSRLDHCDSILSKCTVKNGDAIVCVNELMDAGYRASVELLNMYKDLQFISEESFAGSIDVVKHHEIERFKRKCFYASREYEETMQTLERADCDAREEYIDRLKVYDHLVEMMNLLDCVHDQLRKMRFRLQDGWRSVDSSIVKEIVGDFEKQLNERLAYWEQMLEEMVPYSKEAASFADYEEFHLDVKKNLEEVLRYVGFDGTIVTDASEMYTRLHSR